MSKKLQRMTHNPTSNPTVSKLPQSHNLNNFQGRIWGRIREVGFLLFVRNPTPILPKLDAVEIMFSFILRQDSKKIPW
jgi:hypothetical protein